VKKLIGKYSQINHPLQVVGLIVVTASFFILAIEPISDIDIWWHLATGRHICQTGSLLNHDPFGLAGRAISPDREIILNGYWLSQIILYKVFIFSAEQGMVIFRAVLISLPIVVTFLYFRIRNISFEVAILASLLLGWGLVYVPGLRPNHLTLLLVPIFFILLAAVGFSAEMDEKKQYNLRAAILLPPFMLLWANLHGGFLLGVAVLALFIVFESGSILHSGNPKKRLMILWGIIVLAIFSTLLNPNGLNIYMQFIQSQGGLIQQKSSEYLSPFVLAKRDILVYWPYFFALFLFIAILFLNRLKISLTKLAIVSFLFLVSTTAFRYAPFFISGFVVFIFDKYEIRRRENNTLKVFTAGVTLALIVLLAWQAVRQVSESYRVLSENPVNERRFPEEAVAFLQSHELSGNIFNHFNWGGYLAWHAPGQLVTFIDGRSLNLRLFDAYTRVLWLPDKTKRILDSNQIDIILVPRLNPFTGELYKLTDYLWQTPEWSFVYHDEVSMVFLRRNAFPNSKLPEIKNRSVIYRDVLKDIAFMEQTSGMNRDLYAAQQFAYLRLGKSSSSQ